MTFRRRLMKAQTRVKQLVKPLFFADEVVRRRIRHGPGKGINVFLNRRTDLQREFGLYESELSGFYERWIATDSIVYDVGAADGVTSLTFASLAPDGHVYAFEQGDEPAAEFVRNVAANPRLAPRTTLVEDTVGETTTRLDDFADARQPPDFVKIDVDGGELDVLETMRGLLANHRIRLVVETHSAALEESCTRFLRGAGHEVRIVGPAWWRAFYPEFRPIDHNRWLVSAARA